VLPRIIQIVTLVGLPNLVRTLAAGHGPGRDPHLTSTDPESAGREVCYSELNAIHVTALATMGHKRPNLLSFIATAAPKVVSIDGRNTSAIVEVAFVIIASCQEGAGGVARSRPTANGSCNSKNLRSSAQAVTDLIRAMPSPQPIEPVASLAGQRRA
jgi:hypothetical protein